VAVRRRYQEWNDSSAFDVRDVWAVSHSGNTNEILWGAKVAARLPWVSCVIRLRATNAGMDQPTYTPVQRSSEGRDTLFFSFQDLDATKPAGSVRSGRDRRHTSERSSGDIIAARAADQRSVSAPGPAVMIIKSPQRTRWEETIRTLVA